MKRLLLALALLLCIPAYAGNGNGNPGGLSGSNGTVTSVTLTGDGLVLSSTPSSAVTTSGTLTATAATQTANTVLGATSTSLSALSMPSCSTSGSALKWTSGSGFSCNTSIAAATVTTNANLSGVVTSSGNTTSFGSFSSATLGTALTDETGSGSVVFSASPTLTGTLSAATITASGVVTGTSFISPPSTLSISTSTFTPVAVASNTYRVVLVHASCPCTIANPSGSPVDGQKFIMEIWQSATGSDTVSWGANYDFGTAGAPTLSTGASKGDFLGFAYSAQNSKYNYIGIQQGM